MKKIAFFALFGAMGWIKAQTTEIKYIPSIATDTITTQAKLYTSLLNGKKFNPLVLEQGIKVGERRKEINLKDKDIFYLEFTDKEGKKRVFQQIPSLGLGSKLVEVMTLGKISWYRNYFSYKTDAWDSSYAHDDYFVKGNNITKVPVKGKYKKKLRDLFADQQELAQETKFIINDDDILELIKKYNQK